MARIEWACLGRYSRLLGVCAGLVLAGTLGATELTSASRTAFTQYASPYAPSPPVGRASEPLSGQVLLVVVRGLRLDALAQMPTLKSAADRAAQRTVRVGAPSLTGPALATLATGAGAEQHGQTSDGQTRPVALDSLFQSARRSGFSAAVAGSADWAALFPGQFDALWLAPSRESDEPGPTHAREQDDEVERRVLTALPIQPERLLLIEFAEPELAAHAQGVGSSAYTAAVQSVDARLGRMLASLDWGQRTLLLTSDHGVTDRGGQGGTEPEVQDVPLLMFGKAVKPGQYEPAAQVDIAPTVATLLGLPVPADNQGSVLFDMLAMPASLTTERAVDWAEQVTQRHDRMAQVVGVGSMVHPQLTQAEDALAANDAERALAAAQAEVAATREASFAFREGRLQQESLFRAPLFLLFLLPLVLYARWMYKRGWGFRRPLLGALLYFVGFYSLFVVRGYSLSWSVLGGTQAFAPWFDGRSGDSFAAGIVAVLAVSLVWTPPDSLERFATAVHTAAFVCGALWLQVCLFYWLYGFTWAWFIPDSSRAFGYFLDLAQLRGVAAAVPLLVLVLWAISRLPNDAALPKAPAGH